MPNTADIAAEAGVRVRKLEWEDDWTGVFFAHTKFGMYFASDVSWWFANELVVDAAGIEAAKAAAQADFEARILAAIEPQAVAEPVAFVPKRALDGFDVNGTEIVDALLCPKGTLRPDGQIALYASPVTASDERAVEAPVTDAMVDAAVLAWRKAWNGPLSAYDPVPEAMRLALEAAIASQSSNDPKFIVDENGNIGWVIR